MRSPLPPTDLISVIVPIFKMEKYLQLCVDSILSQTYTNLEILLIDDQSPDNCWQMMQNYATRDTRVKIYKKPENGGLSDARNFGLERIHGNYVAFVDADDFINPTMLEKMYSKAVQENADIVLCSYDRFENVGENSPPRADIAKAMQLLSQRPRTATEVYPIFFNLGTTVWRGLFRADLISKYNEPFPKGLYYEDDYWHTFYRLRAQKIAAVNEPLYHYRARTDSISGGKKHSSHIIEILKRFEAANSNYLNDPVLRENYNNYKPAALQWHMISIVRNNKFKDAVKMISEIKHLLKGIECKNKKLNQLIKDFNKKTAEQLYYYIYWLAFIKLLEKVLKSTLQIRISRHQHQAYIRLLGIKIDLRHIVYKNQKNPTIEIIKRRSNGVAYLKFLNLRLHLGKLLSPDVSLPEKMRRILSYTLKSIFKVCIRRANKPDSYIKTLGLKIGIGSALAKPTPPTSETPRWF